MTTFADKTVLITGGTGSFGKTVATYLQKSGVGEIRIFSRDEEKQDDMRKNHPASNLRYIIGDVRDRRSVSSAVQGVDMIFHAAALKQVPSCEFFPHQAVQTNILGSSNVVECAVESGVKSAVFLSTDKAVFPVNAMGMSKALMEKVVQAKAREIGPDSVTTLSCVRYGNVMFSRGSVIPLFIGQLLSNKNLTITHPEMTRFLMPLSDAVNLVVFALENADQGDTFVKKAPAASVSNLATALIRLFDKSNELDFDVVGIRHGEKMYESLMSTEESARAKELDEYFRVPLDTRSLEYKKYFTDGNVSMDLCSEYNSDNTYQLSVEEIMELIEKLPEYAKYVNDQG